MLFFVFLFSSRCLCSHGKHASEAWHEFAMCRNCPILDKFGSNGSNSRELFSLLHKVHLLCNSIADQIKCGRSSNPRFQLPFSRVVHKNNVKDSKEFMIAFFVELSSVVSVLRFIFIENFENKVERTEATAS